MDEPLDAAAYARLVRRALADLPADTVDDLLEDLDEHLAEVAAEGGRLTDRLGPPQAYAQELRRAAGLPQPAGPRAARSAPVRQAAARLSREPAVRSALAFLVELRPAWWVLRAVVAVLALTVVFGVQLFGLVVLLLVPAAVVLSVRLGRRAERAPAHDRRALLLTRAANGGLAAVAVVALAAVLSSGAEDVYAGEPAPYGPGVVGSTLVHEDGASISNIYPYSSTGQPLSGVLLYDQAGRPISNLADTDEQGRQVTRVLPTDAPPPPGNAFPQPQQVVAVDEYGQPVTPVPAPPAVVPPAVVPPVGVAPTVAPTTPAPDTVAPGTAPPTTAAPRTAPARPATPSPRATRAPAVPRSAAPTPSR